MYEKRISCPKIFSVQSPSHHDITAYSVHIQFIPNHFNSFQFSRYKETDRDQLTRCIRRLGSEMCLNMYHKTLEIQEKGKLNLKKKVN